MTIKHFMIGAMKQSMILINKEATKMKLKELKNILKSENGNTS